MIDQTVVIYCICDEVTKSLGIQDDSQCRMSSAEIMTFAVMSATLFSGNYTRTRVVSRHHQYFKTILSLSQLVRRIHAIPEQGWSMVFTALRLILTKSDCKTFIIDSFPVKAYRNHKSFRARIFAKKMYHGYTASKKRYFFGLKIHMVTTSEGVPVEFVITPGSVSDITGLKMLTLDLPEGSLIYADRAYTDYALEDLLQELDAIHLIPKRKANLKRQHSLCTNSCLNTRRNRIETAFSSIISRMPRHISARTEQGFCLKLMLFILAYMVNLYFPLG